MGRKERVLGAPAQVLLSLGGYRGHSGNQVQGPCRISLHLVHQHRPEKETAPEASAPREEKGREWVFFRLGSEGLCSLLNVQPLGFPGLWDDQGRTPVLFWNGGPQLARLDSSHAVIPGRCPTWVPSLSLTAFSSFLVFKPFLDTTAMSVGTALNCIVAFVSNATLSHCVGPCLFPLTRRQE